MHRATWIAIPVVALAVFGTATGWWGYYDQNQKRQALAVQAENHYASSFHQLVADTEQMQDEIGISLVSEDKQAFQKHMRDIWRLSYAAQTDVANLPFSLMPMHHVQQLLGDISLKTNDWMNHNTAPLTASVQTGLKKMYGEASQVNSSLQSLQGKILSQNLSWLDATQNVDKEKTDNQIVDGFRKLDGVTSAFVESSASPTSTLRGQTFALSKEKSVTPREATSDLADFVGGSHGQGWKATATKKGAAVPDYLVTGRSPYGEVSGAVSQNGGHVLTFNLTNPTHQRTISFAESQQLAADFLQQRGFGKVMPIESNQYDGTGYFVFAPEWRGVPVVSRGIVVQVSLQNGRVTAFDGSSYYYYPVTSVPKRVYSAEQLRKKLNPRFLVRESMSVVALDENHQYQPAVAFSGTSHGETYRVFMNAHTGEEMHVEQLTSGL